MKVGIDFDNTIACYDRGFREVAVAMALVPPDFQGGKKAVRDYVRQGPGGDGDWQRLQARLYGPDIGHAHVMEGMDRLLERLRARRIEVVIVSHKSRTSPLDPTCDLRQAALGWMTQAGLFDRFGIDPSNVYFEATRTDKIARITSLGCTHFIDDLEEVFTEPAFPPATQAYLFAAGYDSLPQGPFQAFRTLDDIGDTLLGTEPARTAERLLGQPPLAVESGNRGGNNRLYRVTMPDEGVVAMKCYPAPDADPRARAQTEWAALSFLHRAGETAVPTPLRYDPARSAALYQWIDGRPVGAPGLDDIDQALAFCARLHGYRLRADAGALPLASEACLSGCALLAQIDARLERFAEMPELAEICAHVKAARLRYAVAEPMDLAPEQRTLSPSDFGFHNALRVGDSKLVFLDFEYFGWDDPVKLTADTLLHPGFTLSSDGARRLADGMAAIYGSDPDFGPRLTRHYPLYVLRWVLILLNEFLPERLARRVAAGLHDPAGAKARQLAKAQAMLARIAQPFGVPVEP